MHVHNVIKCLPTTREGRSYNTMQSAFCDHTCWYREVEIPESIAAIHHYRVIHDNRLFGEIIDVSYKSQKRNCGGDVVDNSYFKYINKLEHRLDELYKGSRQETAQDTNKTHSDRKS